MFKSHARVLHGTSVPSPLAFHTTCCRREISISHLLRAERCHSVTSSRCAACEQNLGHPHYPRRPSYTKSHARSSGFLTTTPSLVSRDAQQWRSQNCQPRHGFHTKPDLLFHQGHAIQGVSPSPKRSGPLPPVGPPRVPPPGPPAPRHPHAKPAPPSGSRRRVGHVENDQQQHLSNPIEEMRREREQKLQQLRIPQRMVQWDKRVEEVLSVGQQNLNNGSSVTRATISNEVAQARKTARAHWHVERLMTPLDRQLKQYVANIARVKDECGQLRGDIQASRKAHRKALRLFHRSVFLQASEALDNSRRIKAVNDKLRATAHRLQTVEQDFSNESLKPLFDDLKSAGWWEKPAANFPLQGVSPRGATPKSRNVRRALAGILFAREELLDYAHSINIDLHLLRRARRTRALCRQPDVSQFRFRGDRLYHTVYLIGTNLDSITIHYHRLRTWLRTSSEDRWKVPFYTQDRFHRLFERMSETVSAMRDEYHDHLSSITAVGIKSNFALQQAQLLEFRSLVVWLTRFHDMNTNVQEVIDSSSIHYATRRNLQEWLKDSKELRREFWDAVDVAISWRGAANICFGIVTRPFHQSPVMMSATTTTKSNLPRPTVDILPEKQTRLPWAVSGNLYPEEGGIPVHFVTTANHASMVLQRFSGCKVVGLDLVVKPNSDMRLGSSRAHFDYLVLASGREVAIFHLGVLRASVYRKSILDDPAILKVGVNMQKQRKLLEEHCAIDLIGYHDLTPKTNGSADDHETELSNPTTVSSVVARKFGTVLPEIDLSLASLSVYSQDNPLLADPPQFFTSLASRGYAALQLYHSACLAAGVTDLPGMVAPGASQAVFGPVSLHTTLRRVSLAMVKHVFREHKERLRRSHTMLRSIQAYYLFTSFGEDLTTIRACLQIPNPAAVIYTVAEQYKLPLRAEYREGLKAARGFVSNSVDGLQALPSGTGISKVKVRARRAKSNKVPKAGVQALSSRSGTKQLRTRARPTKSITVRRVAPKLVRSVRPEIIRRVAADPSTGANGSDRNGTLERHSRPPKRSTLSKKSLASESSTDKDRAAQSKRRAKLKKVETTTTAETTTNIRIKGEQKTQEEASAMVLKSTTKKTESVSWKPLATVESGPASSPSTVETRPLPKSTSFWKSKLARRKRASARIHQFTPFGAPSEVSKTTLPKAPRSDVRSLAP
ncbi:hypothetical protein EDD36DRAFT_272367 [Exophiala viscosa]|uniref:Uncharacterized protein n=1 Tax=Exophiala viscosa TaxID=2486360 RepID=A0AAN6DT06_9EURO|nr:hypothetical protein EDD36DRAFT_272367 [Exophiala viscosa]